MALSVELHMKEGTDETSYAKCSYMQKQALLLTKPIMEEAIRDFYNKQRPQTLCIADLGCSSAELNNQTSVVYDLVATVEKASRKLGHDTHQDYQIYLNDLPGNDFNTVFRSLTSFQEKLKQSMGDGFGHCFVSGVPGSFYGRLFPNKSLHFVHSSYSLHWLSQVPKGIDENKRNICISRRSPPSVVKAYYEQFQDNFSMFLRCRSMEIVPGGCMVLTCLGRHDNQPSTHQKTCYMYELLATVLNDMVVEGDIEEEKLNSFNIPHYSPSAAEIELLVKREGSFTVNQVHISEIPWEGEFEIHNYNNIDNKDGDYSHSFDHYDFAKCMRSVMEPLLVAHFGESIIDEVFKRYTEIVRVSQAKQSKVVTNVTVTMTKKLLLG